MPAPTVPKPRRARSMFSFRISRDREPDTEDRPNPVNHHSPRRRISMSSIRAWATGHGRPLRPVSISSDSSPNLRSHHCYSFLAGEVETAFELDGRPIANSSGPYELSAEVSDDEIPLSKLREKLRKQQETFSLAEMDGDRSPDISSIIVEPSKGAARYRRRNARQYPASMVDFPLGTQAKAPPSAPFQERAQRQPIFRRPSVSSQALSFMSAPTIILHPSTSDLDHGGPHSWGFCHGCGRDLQSIEERDSEDEDALSVPAPKPQSPPRKTRRHELVKRLAQVNSREFATESFLKNNTTRARPSARNSPSLSSVSVVGSEPCPDTWSGTSYDTGSTPLTVPSFRSTRSTRSTSSRTSRPDRRSPSVAAPNRICARQSCCGACPRCQPYRLMHSARGTKRAPSPPYFGPGPSPGQVVPSFCVPGNGRWMPLVAQREEWLQSHRIGAVPGMSYRIAGEPAWMRRGYRGANDHGAGWPMI